MPRQLSYAKAILEATDAALPLAVCLHGAAADHLVANGVGPFGLTASELPDAARALLNAATRGASHSR